MSTQHSTSIFWDAGERTFRRDHLIIDGAFLGIASAHSKFGARTIGLVASAVANCAPPFTRPDEVRAMLLACSARIAASNQDHTDDHGTASVVLVWEKFERRIEFAQCGGGHVFHMRGSTLRPILEANTVGRLVREHGQQAPAQLEGALVSMLGVPDPQIALSSIDWEPDDLVVVVSASAKASTDELLEVVRAAGNDVGTMAGRIGKAILDRSRTFGVTVIVQRLRLPP